MKTKRILSAIAACLAAAMCLPLSSCVTGVSAKELSAGYERQATDSGEESEALWAAVCDFSFKILGETLGADAQNTMLSPYSIAMCLGMLTEGADGETRAQLEALFGMDSDTLARALHALTVRLSEGDDAALAVADSIWMRDGFDVKADFLQRNADWYSAQVYSAPFDSTTVKDINAWCSKNTNGMIDKIIDTVSADTIMYLINAVCFDAEWQEKYEKSDITDDIFKNRDGSESNVKMLSSSGEKYLKSNDLYGFARNYKGGRFSFVGLLPEDEDADIIDAAKKLSGATWRQMWQSSKGSTYAYIPEFKMEYKAELNGALRELGVSDVFDGSAADLSRIAGARGALFCSKIEHKTYFELDRHGTRAAAVTWGMVNCTSADIKDIKVVKLDRPFIAMIVDNESGIPVFCGVVTSIGQ